MKYNEQDLAALISEVEAEFSEHMKKSESTTQVSKKEVPAENTTVEYNDQDIQEMDELYTSMTKSELEAHYDSVKKALNVEDTVEKSEKVEDEVEKVAKSELDAKVNEINELKENNEKLEKSLSDLISKMKTFVTKTDSSAPKQKAITKSVDFIAKSEGENEEASEDVSKLSKNEITQRLKTKAADPELKKSDRSAINEYYQKDQSDIKSIRHLL